MIKSNKGVTFIELAISIAVIGILSYGTARFFRNTFDIWWMTSDSVDVHSKSRIALNELSRYVRQASELPQIDGNNSIKFKISISTSDWGGDNTVKYFQAGNNLRRMMRNSTTTLVEGGVDDFYVYLTTGTSSKYAHVGATLTVTQSDKRASLSQKIMLRGLKGN
ncbi:MAG: PilW family protein [Elusimicrobiota bacterium]